MPFFSKKFILIALSIAVTYIVLTIYMMNFSLVKMTILGNFSIAYKVTILGILLEGMWTAMTHPALALLVVTALLTGINLTLIGETVTRMNGLKNVHYVAGGGLLLGVIGSGCAACGLPILALLGLSGSVAFLPLRGMELSYLSVLLLLLSLYVLTRNVTQQSCKININKRLYE